MTEDVNEKLRFLQCLVFTNVLWSGCRNDNSRQCLQLKKIIIILVLICHHTRDILLKIMFV